MHELSIVESIIDTVANALKEQGGPAVERIDLEIGELSAFEMPALEFAWRNATPGTVLGGSEFKFNIIKGLGRCRNCDSDYHAPAFYTPCPTCGNYGNDIINGKDVVIKSITIKSPHLHPVESDY